MCMKNSEEGCVLSEQLNELKEKVANTDERLTKVEADVGKMRSETQVGLRSINNSIANGAWVVSATKASANKCNANNLNIQMGTNRGTSNPIDGSIDLNYCYVMYDGQLLWEGVRGAYKNVHIM